MIRCETYEGYHWPQYTGSDQLSAKKHISTVSSVEELAHLLSLEGSASGDALCRKVLRDTQFDVEMAISYTEKKEAVTESWQIEVTRDFPRPTVRMRQGGRGAWCTHPCDVPDALLEYTYADHTLNEIRSTRSWACWTRGRWMDSDVRRHRSKSGVLRYSVTLSGIERPTGEAECEVSLSPLAADGAAVEAIRLLMPFRPDEFIQALNEIKAQAGTYLREIVA